MGIEAVYFQRTGLLLGKERMKLLAQKRVIILGIGGVGSWCAESLIRTGIQHLTIVDSDQICVTNINRQLHATTKTIGEIKTEVLKNRLLEINPKAQIEALQMVYERDTAHLFDFNNFDYVVDAIDSLSNKALLIHNACESSTTLVASMGSALKIDSSRIKTGDFWKVSGCKLASAVRKRLRRGKLTSKPFMCVYSDEALPNFVDYMSDEEGNGVSDNNQTPSDNSSIATHGFSQKAVINGSLVHITAIFGFTLAGLVVKDIYEQIIE